MNSGISAPIIIIRCLNCSRVTVWMCARSSHRGLEMLANQYAGDMFGEGAEAFEFETVTDMLYVIIMSCMLQEV